MSLVIINITTILAEVSLVIIFFFLVDWSFGKLLFQISAIPWLEKNKGNMLKIRRNIRGFLFLSGFVISLAVIGINGFLIYRGENVRDYSLELLRRIPTGLWIDLGMGILKSIAAIAIAGITLRIANRLLDRVSKVRPECR